MPLSPGAMVAGYTIEAVLGAGGMGTVYKARNPALPRSDALKVLSEELSRDDHFRARFLREADLAATLDITPISSPSTRAARPRTVSCGSRCSMWQAATPRTRRARGG